MKRKIIQRLAYIACFFAIYMFIALIIKMIEVDDFSISVAFSEITIRSYVIGIGTAFIMSFANFGKIRNLHQTDKQ